MKRWVVLLLSILLVACETVPTAPQTEQFFNDTLFASPSQRIRVEDVFALSADMRRYLDTEIAAQVHIKGSQQALFDALYSKGQLKLEYDATTTRNAAQTFAARTGNCLSLVIMTAAFAKALGLPVQYHRVLVDDNWSRSGDLYFFSQHVNITLGKRPRTDVKIGYDSTAFMTIDFLPSEDTAGQRTSNIGEETIVAMYMNNRAAELLAGEHLDDAYWWAREAIRQDPTFFAAYNTLGVIYQHHGNAQQAQRVLAQVLEHDPENTLALSNLVPVLNDLGRVAEARQLRARLAQVEPNPPYRFFWQGQAAMRHGDFGMARELFAKEVERDPYNAEFQFWLASAYFRLGDIKQASNHMTLALENSTTYSDRALYAAKLNRLKAYHAN